MQVIFETFHWFWIMCWVIFTPTCYYVRFCLYNIIPIGYVIPLNKSLYIFLVYIEGYIYFSSNGEPCHFFRNSFYCYFELLIYSQFYHKMEIESKWKVELDSNNLRNFWTYFFKNEQGSRITPHNSPICALKSYFPGRMNFYALVRHETNSKSNVNKNIIFIN